jgi:hypothetical protein
MQDLNRSVKATSGKPSTVIHQVVQKDSQARHMCSKM